MKVRAIIQARMLSSRLRGKSLMAVAGVPLLYRVVESVKKIPFIDEIMVATTFAEADDPIAAAANNLGVNIFRGDSMNVLKRFKDASADMEEEDLIVRFTADNPIYNIDIAQKVFESHIAGNFDYSHIDRLSHIVPELIKVRALREMHYLVTDSFDQEHVTPYLRKHKNEFKIQTLVGNYEGLRDDLDRYLTIDTAEDLVFFEKMLDEINSKAINFKTIYQWLDDQLQLQKNESGQLIKLGNINVGDGQPAFIIAEIGQNHNGNIDFAKKLIDMAKDCGASAVKFQKRDIPSELTKEAFNRPYDNSNSFGATYGEHRMFLELDEHQHLILKEYAQARGIIYFCTPCDVPSVELLERIDCPFYKVASRDLTNIPLLEALTNTDKPVIISTGMASLDDIDGAIETLQLGKDKLIILQCTSQYPCAIENVNLKVMDTLKEKYGLITGFSDHTSGVVISTAAVVRGAAVIEKHITLDRTMKGTDQPGSLEKAGLAKLVEYIRACEAAIGDGVKMVNPVTASAKTKLARSVTSKVDIKKGDVLTEEMICLKSPGDGIKWRNKENILGKKATQNIDADVTLKIEDFE